MPSSTRPATSGSSNAPLSSKRSMSDSESTPQVSKKARRSSSANPPSSRRDASRDTKRRRKKKKKTPVVGTETTRDEVALARPDSSSRAPLSVRNEIVRFTSALPEAGLQANAISDSMNSFHIPSFKQAGKSQASLLPVDQNSTHQFEAMPSVPKDIKGDEPADGFLPEPSSGSLEDRVAKLEAELKSKNSLIASHHALLGQVQQAVTCQVCLDLMYKPYALAPCGHIACHSCLVNWFTAPPSDNRPVPPPMMRRKTCPHCRAVVRERPVEVWGVKSIAQAVGKSGLLANQLPVTSESNGADTDPWKDIFPKSGPTSSRSVPWFLSGADTDDDDIHIGDRPSRGEDVGMLDMEDGGIYRCLDCMHEIWDGICTGCGRVYLGHRPHGDDEDYEENPMGWLEDQMGAEEVDVEDDPGWMGLEEGEADDAGGDIDDWRPFDPWRRQLHMFRGPWGFLGTIHVDEDEEDDIDGHITGLRVLDEDEESGDEGYESSFIDDDDERGGINDFFDGPRFYEINDDEDGEHGTANAVSDDHEDEEHDRFDVERTSHRHIAAAFSSDREANRSADDAGPSECRWRQRRGHGIIESDGSDWSDE